MDWCTTTHYIGFVFVTLALGLPVGFIYLGSNGHFKGDGDRIRLATYGASFGLGSFLFGLAFSILMDASALWGCR